MKMGEFDGLIIPAYCVFVVVAAFFVCKCLADIRLSNAVSTNMPKIAASLESLVENQDKLFSVRQDKLIDFTSR